MKNERGVLMCCLVLLAVSGVLVPVVVLVVCTWCEFFSFDLCVCECCFEPMCAATSDLLKQTNVNPPNDNNVAKHLKRVDGAYRAARRSLQESAAAQRLACAREIEQGVGGEERRHRCRHEQG